jgi:hypothetical protein
MAVAVNEAVVKSINQSTAVENMTVHSGPESYKSWPKFHFCKFKEYTCKQRLYILQTLAN